MRFIVEVWSDNNSPLLFPPLKEILRPRWITTNVKRPAHESIAKMPVLPGIRLWVDTDRREVGKFDPLAHTPEGKAAWEQAQLIMAGHRQHYGGATRLDKKVLVRRGCSDDMLKTFVYWIRRAMDLKNQITDQPIPAIRHIQGDTVPTMHDIFKMPGRIEIGQCNDTWASKNYREFLDEKAAVNNENSFLGGFSDSQGGLSGLDSALGLGLGGAFGGDGASLGVGHAPDPGVGSLQAILNDVSSRVGGGESVAATHGVATGVAAGGGLAAGGFMPAPSIASPSAQVAPPVTSPPAAKS